MRHILLLMMVAVLLIPASAKADEEEFLGWSELKIVSVPNRQTGRVEFTAQVSIENKWHKVEVDVFGKKFQLDERQREALSSFPLSSINTTHSAGYEAVGGHTVNFKFHKDEWQDGRLIRSEVSISISRGKGLSVNEPRHRVLKEREG